MHFVGDDILRLYEEWVRTRSEWIEQRLKALGVLVPGPIEPDGGGVIQ